MAIRLKSILLLAAAAITALGAGLGPPPPDNRSAEELINQLAADKPRDRDNAQRQLAEDGDSATEPLKRALDDPRPEVRNRAVWCLRYIRFLGRQDLTATDARAMGLARSYLNSVDPAGRLNLLGELLQMQPPPEAVLLRLYTLESDASLRVRLMRPLGPVFDRESARMIREGDTAAVAMLLEGMVAAAPHEAGADYAMLLRSTDRLDEGIARWKAQHDNGSSPEQRRYTADVLAFLYRAAGKYQESIVSAREAGDPRLTLSILAGHSDFKNFENSVALLQVCTPVVQAGLKAACERMLGRPDTLATFMARAASSATDDENSFVPSRCYLLNDDPARGIELLARRRPAMVIGLLSRRGDYSAALAAADNALVNDPGNTQVRAEVAGLRQSLGIDPLPEPELTPDIRPFRAAASQPVKPEQIALDDLQHKQYSRAADRFKTLADRFPENPELLYMQGYATFAGGDVTAGRALMKEAELIPLGSPQRRWAFAARLGEWGLVQEQNQQFELALQTGASFDEIGYADIYASKAEQAEKAGLWGEAADAWDRLVLVNLTPELQWQSASEFLTVPAEAHLAHARDYWQRGMKKQSLAEYDRFEKYFPADAGNVIDLVAKLDDAGDHDEADKRFDRLWNQLSATIKKYPKSPTVNNNLAWLAACCNRKLDEALPFAEAAAKYEPGTGPMDTLAELHFRRGERGAAIELASKILAVTPDSDPGREYAKRQADRFAHAVVPSTTQPVEEPK